MKLYGFPPTRSIRVLWTLRELDVEFEFVNVDPSKGEHRRPEFLAVNPAGKLLDNLPRLRGFMERMYKRPNAPPRIAEAFASLRR